MNSERAVILGCFKDIPGDVEANWNQWYASSHIPARLALPGFMGARRFRASEGDYRYVSLYELLTAEAVSSEPYKKLKQKETAKPADSFEAQTLQFPGFLRGIYRQIYPDTEYCMPDAEHLLMVAHDVPSDREDEFNAWYNTEHIPAMLRVPSVVSARRFTLVQNPALPDVERGRPKFLTLYDLTDEFATESPAFIRARDTPWSNRVRGWATCRARVVAQQITRQMKA